MPGIITHKRIFFDSLKLLAKRKNRSYLLQSINALFTNSQQLKAALFGILGPNIFDYIPMITGKKTYGHPISFAMHNGQTPDLLRVMIEQIYSYEDKNNEWSATQRAYLYGFISHLIADEILHPYIFYRSGFPDSVQEVNHFREQNLLFQYNIDNYFLYLADDKDDLAFDISAMIPFSPLKRRHLNPAVKEFILSSLHKAYPEIYNKIIWRDIKEDSPNFTSTFGWLDVLPYLIIKTQNLKQNYNERVRKIMGDLNHRKFFYSDFIVQYQWPKKTNIHHLNFHREDWLNPAGSSAIRYESVTQLCKLACEKTVSLWEQIEKSLYTANPEEIAGLKNINAYTGCADEDYFAMKRKSPVRLRP